MEKLTLSTDFDVFNSMEELPKDVQDLMEKAVSAREKSYSPYSKFKVGAALLLENGEVISGNNQENAAYPAGLCAERTALFYAGANFPQEKMLKMAISAKSPETVLETPVPPCGFCRQAIAEYEINQQESIEIYFMGEKGKIIKSNSVADLLPLLFDKSYL